jgi:hypothetical protein
MSNGGLRPEEAAIFEQFDRSSPDGLLRSIAKEFARLSDANARLAARVSALEAVSAFSDRIAAGEVEEIGAVYPSSVHIGADEMYRDAVGFHRVEYDDIGRPFRWSGPDRQFSFQFFIDRKRSARFIMRFDGLFAAAPVEQIACLVDGEPTALQLRRNGDALEATGSMASRSDRGGSVLTFVAPRVETPESRGLPDSRPLGLCFRWLKVETEAETAMGGKR